MTLQVLSLLFIIALVATLHVAKVDAVDAWPSDACENSYMFSASQSSPSTTWTVGQINAILKAHNNARRNVDPMASKYQNNFNWGSNNLGMRMLVWDQKLANNAAAYIRNCPGMVHSSSTYRSNVVGDNVTYSSVGENLAAGYGSTAYNNDTIGVTGTGQWNAELTSKTWTYSCNPFNTTGTCNGAGHYTQVVSSRTWAVGCGSAYCPNDPYKNYLCCQYGEAGNMNVATSPVYNKTTNVAEASPCQNISKWTTTAAPTTVAPSTTATTTTTTTATTAAPTTTAVATTTTTRPTTTTTTTTVAPTTPSSTTLTPTTSTTKPTTTTSTTAASTSTVSPTTLSTTTRAATTVAASTTATTFATSTTTAAPSTTTAPTNSVRATSTTLSSTITTTAATTTISASSSSMALSSTIQPTTSVATTTAIPSNTTGTTTSMSSPSQTSVTPSATSMNTQTTTAFSGQNSTTTTSKTSTSTSTTSSAPPSTSTTTTTTTRASAATTMPTTTSLPTAVFSVTLQSSALASHASSQAIVAALAADIARKLNTDPSHIAVTLRASTSGSSSSTVEVSATVSGIALASVSSVSTQLNATKETSWLVDTTAALQQMGGGAAPSFVVMSSSAAAPQSSTTTTAPTSSSGFCSDNLIVCVAAPIGGFFCLLLVVVGMRKWRISRSAAAVVEQTETQNWMIQSNPTRVNNFAPAQNTQQQRGVEEEIELDLEDLEQFGRNNNNNNNNNIVNPFGEDLEDYLNGLVDDVHPREFRDL